MQMYLTIQGEVDHPVEVVTDIKGQKISKRIQRNSNALMLTTNGKSQDMPLPLCRAATVVGPTRDGIQKKPSARSPYRYH